MSDLAMDDVTGPMNEPPPPVVDQDDLPEQPRKERKLRVQATREPRESKPMEELRDSDDRSITSWLKSLSPTGAVKVRVSRLEPTLWQGKNTGGVVGRYDEMIDDATIEARHGGGTYLIHARKPAANGGWQFGGERTIKIAGDPRTDDVYRTPPPPAPEPPPVVAGPSPGTIELLTRSNERLAEMARNSGPDVEAMRVMMAPLQGQIDQLAGMLREKDRQLAAAQQPKPVERDEFRDRMLDKLLDGESARIVALRSQYESELRQVKQSAIDNEARIRDGFERDKQGISMSHEREVNALRSSYDMKVAAQEQAHSTARSLLEGEIRRLAADLAEAKAELVALRAKKDKTVIEQATELAQLKEALGADDKSEEKSGWERAIEVAGNLPAVQGILSRVAGAEGAPQQPAPVQPQVQARPARLLTGPDGNLYRQLPTGQLEMVRRRQQPVPATPPGEPGAPPIPAIPETTIKTAVGFLEAAYRNNQDPVEVATSVRSMVPADVLTAIRQLGIDGFLTNVAKLDGTSPLSSQAGRNWTRKLGKVLVGE